jgi:hypothetical protein
VLLVLLVLVLALVEGPLALLLLHHLQHHPLILSCHYY